MDLADSFPHPSPVPHQDDDLLALGRDVLRAEADAVRELADRLDDRFVDAVSLLIGCKGRVVVSGIGKSGHIARKIAATMASTGTPAFFVHPAEAGHGDLGMITPHDVLIAISYSGESSELLLIVPMLKRHGARMITMTGNPESSLARLADVSMDAGVSREADPLGLAPSSSTTAALALGDALAFALLKARGFSADDFARTHPSGLLGRRLLLRVADVMRTGDALPAVEPGTALSDTLVRMSRSGLGMTAIVDQARRVLGIFTDGDLRRALEQRTDIHAVTIERVMTRTPHTISSDKLAMEALRFMEEFRISVLIVTSADGRLIGALNMHDLFRAGLV